MVLGPRCIALLRAKPMEYLYAADVSLYAAGGVSTKVLPSVAEELWQGEMREYFMSC